MEEVEVFMNLLLRARGQEQVHKQLCYELRDLISQDSLEQSTNEELLNI